MRLPEQVDGVVAMARALVNAHNLVPVSQVSGHLSSNSSSSSNSELEWREGVQAAGIRGFPLKPLLRSKNIRNIRKIRASAENGSSNRMVPIEEALQGRTATFLSKRPTNNGTISCASCLLLMVKCEVKIIQ